MGFKFNPLSGEFDIVDSKWELTDSTHGTADTIEPKSADVWKLDLIPNGFTFDFNVAGLEGLVNVTAPITYDFSAGGGSMPSVVYFGSTVTVEQSFSAFGGGFLFRNNGTIKNANGVAANLAPIYTLAAQGTFQADGASITKSFGADVFSGPTLNTINGGTLTVGGIGVPYMQLAAFSFTVGSGVTVADRAGVFVGDATVTGTLTNNYGALIGAMASGTNGFGVVIGDAKTNTLWVNNTNNSTDVAGGIVFGSSKDTNLYRSAANTLTTGILAATDVTVTDEAYGSAWNGVLEVPTKNAVYDALNTTGVGFINHGATAATARPVGFAMVIWYGSVEPDNLETGDIWNQS